VSDTPVVLIIDDDKELLTLVSLLLKRINVQSIPMSSGSSALQWISTAEQLHLVILDLMLPDMDGFEILRRIRSNHALDTIPVLILSAKADPTTIRYGLDNGADGYVTKPYLAANLVSRVEALLQASR
jgi:DNA-binding response OmpR family regulator